MSASKLEAELSYRPELSHSFSEIILSSTLLFTGLFASMVALSFI